MIMIMIIIIYIHTMNTIWFIIPTIDDNYIDEYRWYMMIYYIITIVPLSSLLSQRLLDDPTPKPPGLTSATCPSACRTEDHWYRVVLQHQGDFFVLLQGLRSFESFESRRLWGMERSYLIVELSFRVAKYIHLRLI